MSTEEPAPDDAGQQRDRSLRLAVITSLISKVGTILLRVISIPIAIRLLGMELFGVYAAITMAVGILDMLHIGIGPALTKELSKALAKKDRERETTIFSTSVILSVGLTLVGIAIGALLLVLIPVPTLFGGEFAPVSDVMARAAWLGLIIIAIEMICIIFEMGRDGYQETRFTNSWGAFGNVVGALALLCGIWFFPTIEFLLIAINGSIALAKLCNTVHLLIQRPYLFPKFTQFKKALVPTLAKDGFRFSITYIMAAAIEYNVMVFLIGRYVGPEAVAVYNVMITIHYSLAGLVGMLTRPYWPALMDAYERRDTAWIAQTSKKLRLTGLGFAILTGIGLITLGPIVLPLWAGEEFYGEVSANFEMDRLALAGFSIYFLAHIWRHTNQVLALGVGWVTPVAWTVVAEGLFLVSATVIVLINTGQISFIYMTMAGSIVLFSGWLFPLYFRKGRLEEAPREGRSDPLTNPI